MTTYSLPSPGDSDDDAMHAETPGLRTREDPSIEARSRASIEGRARASGSSWPSILSAALVVFGLALASLPDQLPQYGWITRSCAAYGLTSAPLVLSGCVLFGVARMLRTLRPGLAVPQLPPQPVPEQEPGPSARDTILEQLASELAQVRGSLQELRVEFVYLKDAQQTLLQLSAQSSPELEGDLQQTAIFRLAASLDQVGARIEQRLKTQHAALQTSLEDVNRELHAAQTQLAHRNNQPESRPRIGLPPSGADGYAIPARGARSDVRARQEQDEDELDVWVELEPPTPRTSLGLLDTLADATDALPAKTSPSIRPAIGREKPRGNLADSASEPAAPLPRLRPAQESPIEAADSNDGDRAAGEDQVEDKLALLRSLLADARVRQALESMRRN